MEWELIAEKHKNYKTADPSKGLVDGKYPLRPMYRGAIVERREDGAKWRVRVIEHSDNAELDRDRVYRAKSLKGLLKMTIAAELPRSGNPSERSVLDCTREALYGAEDWEEAQQAEQSA